jgi:septal ring factor EnvC (AmiA/AmiB activator)|tara:strand:+ start:99 stop:281 length:183 start_codon:yes stop_codon:yes gene_type:complete
MDMIQHLEESYKREIKELNNQLYAQYQRNKVLHEEISFLKTKLSSLEDTLEQLVQEKLNA